MESPFYPNGGNGASSCVTLYLEPYLNTYCNTYHNVITLSSYPAGPLSAMVSRMSVPKLSIFYDTNTHFDNECKYFLMRYPCSNGGSTRSCGMKSQDAFLNDGDIPAVFGYLNNNGYAIQTSLTKMMNGSSVSMGKKVICIFSYLS